MESSIAQPRMDTSTSHLDKELLLLRGFAREHKVPDMSVPRALLLVIIQYFEFIPIAWEQQKVVKWSDQPKHQKSNWAVNLSRDSDGGNWWTTSLRNAKNEWIVFDLGKAHCLYGYQIAMGNQDWGPKTYRIDAWNEGTEDIPIVVVDHVYFEREKGKWEHQKLVKKETIEKYPHFKEHYDGMDVWASTHEFPKENQRGTKCRFWRIHLYEPKKDGQYLALNRVRFLMKFVQ